MPNLQTISDFFCTVKGKRPLKISRAQTKQEKSALKFDISETQTYEWSFEIPPGKKLMDNLKKSHATQYNFTDLQFASGFLKKFKHNWEFKIYASNKFTINFTIDKNPDFAFTLLGSSCKVQVFSQGQLKKTKKLKLFEKDKKKKGKSIIWTSNGKKQFYFNYYDRTVYEKLYPEFWNNSGDTLKVIFEIQCESVGKCIKMSSVNECLEPSELEVTTEKYFLSKALSDVTLASQGEEFPAHRLILSCSSPVFESMFQHKMKEAVEGIVSIDDIEPGVLKETLYFIYTGGVKSSTLKDDNLCIGLFKTADKYEIKGLKMKCANSIVETIDLENALEMYILGDMHSEPRFTQRAVKLFELDKEALRDPLKLKDLTHRCPNLAYELMTSANYN